MTHSLELHLDEFLQEALGDYAREHDGSTSSVIRTAALYWLSDRDSGRAAWRAPRFRRESGVNGDDMRVSLDDETWRALEQEGTRQGVEAEGLAEHAVLYFLADLDSGRLASRLEHLGDSAH